MSNGTKQTDNIISTQGYANKTKMRYHELAKFKKTGSTKC